MACPAVYNERSQVRTRDPLCTNATYTLCNIHSFFMCEPDTFTSPSTLHFTRVHRASEFLHWFSFKRVFAALQTSRRHCFRAYPRSVTGLQPLYADCGVAFVVFSAIPTILLYTNRVGSLFHSRHSIGSIVHCPDTFGMTVSHWLSLVVNFDCIHRCMAFLVD